MSRAAIVPGVVALLAAAGCSGDLARQSLVTSLRLFAVAAEPPEAAPGEAVVLTALWHAPNDGDAVFRWSHCRAPAGGAVDRCGGDEHQLPSGLGVDEVSFSVPADTSEELVRLTLCAPVDGDECAEDADAVTAGKRITVGESPTPNANPRIAAFTVELGAGPTDEAAVQLDADDGSAETVPGGDVEELFVSWFATSGTFDDDRSFGPGPSRFDGVWTPEEAGDVHLWAVLRDGRGGTAWAEQDLVVP